MMLKLHKPYSLYKQGKRKNNEDAFFVPNTDFSEELFIVCDGVGGASKGEVASNLACKSISEYTVNNKSQKKNKAFWDAALKYTEQQFTQKINSNDACKGMGTTLVLSYFKAGKAQIVWCGDSRLYQFRNGKIIYRTKDHSFVQKLVDDGQITEEEAQTHPRKNIILRAINGSENPTEVDFEIIDNIQVNDLFLLCSDGIIEGLSDDKLEQIVAFGDNDYDFIIEQLDTFCQTHSNDNYTCVIIPVQGIEKKIEPIAPPPEKEKSFFSKKSGLFLMGFTSLLLLAFAGYFLNRNEDEISEKTNKTTVIKSETLAENKSKLVIDSLNNKGKESEIITDSLGFQNSKFDSLIKIEKSKLINYKPNNSKKKFTKAELENRAAGIGLTEAEQKYKTIKDSLKAIMLVEYFKIDSLRKAENDTTGRFFEVQDLVRGRFLYEVSEFTAAFDALKNWVNHEWKDSLLTQKDWLILHELYSKNVSKDNSDIEALNICEENLRKYFPIETEIDSKKLTTEKDTIQ